LLVPEQNDISNYSYHKRFLNGLKTTANVLKSQKKIQMNELIW